MDELKYNFDPNWLNNPTTKQYTIDRGMNIYYPDGVNRNTDFERYLLFIAVKMVQMYPVEQLNTRRPVVITLYMGQTPKAVEDDLRVNKFNANSGFTRHGSVTEIVVYREEDMAKVLIHELIHAYEPPVYGDYTYRGVDSSINEAYVEAKALYLHVDLWCRFNKKVSEFHNVLSNEIQYRDILMQNVLQMSYRDAWMQNGNIVYFRPRTNILSYYVYSTVLMKEQFETSKSISSDADDISEILTRRLPKMETSIRASTLSWDGQNTSLGTGSDMGYGNGSGYGSGNTNFY